MNPANRFPSSGEHLYHGYRGYLDSVALLDGPGEPAGRARTRRVTLAIPRFHLAPTGEIANDFRESFLSATLVALDASEVRPSAQQTLGAMLASVDGGFYIIVDADGPFLPGDVPELIREVRSGAAFVVRGVFWRTCPSAPPILLRSRSRLALWLANRILRHSRRDALSGLFVIERSLPASDRDP